MKLRTSAAVAALAALSLLPLGSQSALANRDTGGGSGCGDVVASHSVTSRYVTFNFTAYCPYGVYAIEHNFTGSRNGKAVIVSKGQRCRLVSNTLRQCTKSISIPNPSGTQTFDALDEWLAWQNPFTNRTIGSGKLTSYSVRA